MFVFPDGDVTFSLEMDCIPRVGEGVSFGKIEEVGFSSEREYEKYKEEEYEFREWKVEEVSWSIGPEYYVLVMLKEDTADENASAVL